MSERFKVTVEEKDDGYTCRSTLKVVHDGKVLQEHSDGGEPEDNSFGRDWYWVSGAIMQAYEKGLADGRESPCAGEEQPK